MRGRGERRPIAPFGPDLWRDLVLAITYGARPDVSFQPYLDHICDRILEHRRAELRSLELHIEAVGPILRLARQFARDRVEEIDTLTEE